MSDLPDPQTAQALSQAKLLKFERRLLKQQEKLYSLGLDSPDIETLESAVLGVIRGDISMKALRTFVDTALNRYDQEPFSSTAEASLPGVASESLNDTLREIVAKLDALQQSVDGLTAPLVQGKSAS